MSLEPSAEVCLLVVMTCCGILAVEGHKKATINAMETLSQAAAREVFSKARPLNSGDFIAACDTDTCYGMTLLTQPSSTVASQDIRVTLNKMEKEDVAALTGQKPDAISTDGKAMRFGQPQQPHRFEASTIHAVIKKDGRLAILELPMKKGEPPKKLTL